MYAIQRSCLYMLVYRSDRLDRATATAYLNALVVFRYSIGISNYTSHFLDLFRRNGFPFDVFESGSLIGSLLNRFCYLEFAFFLCFLLVFSDKFVNILFLYFGLR